MALNVTKTVTLNGNSTIDGVVAQVRLQEGCGGIRGQGVCPSGRDDRRQSGVSLYN